MEAQLKRVGTPGPQVIGIDEISIRKGHTYRIVVSDLLRGGRSGLAARIARRRAWRVLRWLGVKKCPRIRLAVMDMWKPFRTGHEAHAPQAASSSTSSM